MDWSLWYLFPASVAIATIAMTSGIGGAVFFSPLFILVLKLDPATAIGTALITEFFGFASGVVAYFKRRLIDFKLGRMLLMVSIPSAILGSLFTDLFPPDLIKSIFAVGVFLIGVQIYRSFRWEHSDHLDPGVNGAAMHREVVDARGRRFEYVICNPRVGQGAAATGGIFLGIASVGLAELLEYYLIVRCRVPAPVAVGTAIFVVVISVFFASLGHIFRFATAADPATIGSVMGVVAFTVPGVIVGGQIGPFIQSRVNPEHIKLALAALFAAVGLFMLSTVLI